jgi:hypothetical protein
MITLWFLLWRYFFALLSGTNRSPAFALPMATVEFGAPKKQERQSSENKLE